MSRCFPFPPPSYRKEETALIESIKLKEAQEQTKEKRKRSKGEKKERKEKRVRSYDDEHDTSGDKEHSHKKRKLDDSIDLPKASCPKATVTDAIEQLEKSGLTEECELLYSAPELCESPESTQNSSKTRKAEATGSTIIRFRLPLRKHKDLEPTPANQAQQFSCRTTPDNVKARPAYEKPCFSGRTAPRVTETSAANGRPSFSGRNIPKVPEMLANEKSRFLGRTIPKVPEATLANERPCFSGRTVSRVPETMQAKKRSCLTGRTTLKVRETTVANKRPLLSVRTTSSVSEEAKPSNATLRFSVRTSPRVPEATAASEVPCFSARAASKYSESTPANEVLLQAPKFLEATTAAAAVPESFVQAPRELKLCEDSRVDSSGAQSKSSRRKDKMERRLRDLTVNWMAPPPLPLDTDASDSDLGWLLGSRRSCGASSEDNICELTSRSSEDTSCGVYAVGSFQPRARFLPELDMYLLPYAVPF